MPTILHGLKMTPNALFLSFASKILSLDVFSRIRPCAITSLSLSTALSRASKPSPKSLDTNTLAGNSPTELPNCLFSKMSISLKIAKKKKKKN
ncbi:hypothetical protein AYI70_g7974 [Smittium culicis]|uniref:Uncharacterized protein n=1 Tax=Smittium culicis TaxID=133412 RepID=A0A1R1XI62_9FUNG|nr:hypothetical protein AYI70_g7974 [Smittium culicis]